MSALYILIPIALLFVLLAGIIFFWAVRHEQFEDLERQGSNILFDEPEAPSHGKAPNPARINSPGHHTPSSGPPP